MGTMTRSSTPLCRLFCCSVKVQSNARQQGAQFHVIIFFCSNVISCKDMMTRSSAFLHHVLFLFKRWRSPWARRQGTQSSAQQQRVKLFIVVYFFYSNVGSPHGHHDEELTSSSLCSFVLMLQVNQVHNDEKFSLSSSFFLFQCCKSQGHNDKELSSSSSCFFCSSVVGP